MSTLWGTVFVVVAETLVIRFKATDYAMSVGRYRGKLGDLSLVQDATEIVVAIPRRGPFIYKLLSSFYQIIS